MVEYLAEDLNVLPPMTIRRNLLVDGALRRRGVRACIGDFDTDENVLMSGVVAH